MGFDYGSLWSGIKGPTSPSLSEKERKEWEFTLGKEVHTTADVRKVMKQDNLVDKGNGWS
jgi:hypothetical protein